MFSNKSGKLLFITLFLICCGKEKVASNVGVPPDGTPDTAVIGKTLPAWQEGYLDIHAINTGRGECTFLILPDGTTMMADAASSLLEPDHKYPPPPKKPNENISSGKAISNYISHFLPAFNKKLNYIVLSHFHADHMGGVSNTMPAGPGGTFLKNGVTEVGVEIPFDLILDRGYPDYNYPSDSKSSDYVENYISFLNWAKSNSGATAAQFEAGRNDQMTLKVNPSKYTGFEIRNLAVNGKVWSGSGTGWKTNLPTGINELNAAKPDENIFSNVFQLSYGKFNYFSGGDIQYNGRSTDAWKDIEEPISKVVGKVEVMKANHHGTANANSEALLGKLRPDVVVCHVWRSIQPNPATMDRFIAANNTCKIFSTNLDDENRQLLGDRMAYFRGTGGHVVVRVKPGGDEYYVYVLDDTNEKYEVKSISGPYISR